MNKLKKCIIAVFSFMIFASSLLLTSCGLFKKENKISIVCTIFPEYDWVLEVIKGKEDNFSVTCLASNGEDLHSFEASVNDIVTVSSADVFIYVGGESDSWAFGALKNAKNKNMKVIILIEVLGENAKQEELKEGMQGESDGEVDEHVWLSLKNAKIFTNEIAKKIAEVDDANKSSYLANAQDYCLKLEELYQKFESAEKSANKNTLVFADRFPFRYLTEDYGLNYFAAFSGCSAESEASFQTVVFLANTINDLNLRVILVIENSEVALAETVKNSTNTKDQTILVINSMQSVNLSDNAHYLKIMEQNLEVLKVALG